MALALYTQLTQYWSGTSSSQRLPLSQGTLLWTIYWLQLEAYQVCSVNWLKSHLVHNEIRLTTEYKGARGGAVGWGTAIQARRSRVRFPIVSLEFFIDIILLALGLTQSLTEMSTRYISWGVKAAGAYGWQPYHLQVPIVLKSGNPTLLEPSGPVQACNGIPFSLLNTKKRSKNDNNIFIKTESFGICNLLKNFQRILSPVSWG